MTSEFTTKIIPYLKYNNLNIYQEMIIYIVSV